MDEDRVVDDETEFELIEYFEYDWWRVRAGLLLDADENRRIAAYKFYRGLGVRWTSEAAERAKKRFLELYPDPNRPFC